MSKTTEVAVETVKKDVTVKVLEKINAFQQSGELTLPSSYSPENALKSAMLILSETIDKDKQYSNNVRHDNQIRLRTKEEEGL